MMQLHLRYIEFPQLEEIPSLEKCTFLTDWIADHLSDGCVRIFPFGLFIRMTGIVLFEGCKVISRYLLAALKLTVDNHDAEIETAEELEKLVTLEANRKGRAIATLAFKLSLSFRVEVDLPELRRDRFKFFALNSNWSSPIRDYTRYICSQFFSSFH